jgi:hypothetical protein
MFTRANLFKNILTVQSRLFSTGHIYEIRTNTGIYKITGTAKLHNKIIRKVTVNTDSGSCDIFSGSNTILINKQEWVIHGQFLYTEYKLCFKQ